MVARPQIPRFTPTFLSAFNLKCCSVPLTFDSTFYFCFIKWDSNLLIYVIFNAAYSKYSKFMSKEEMFKTSGNFIGLQALLRIMIDLLQMSLCELYVIFAVVPLIFISITHSFHHVLNKSSGPQFTWNILWTKLSGYHTVYERILWLNNGTRNRIWLII